jgi:hypothetical protein
LTAAVDSLIIASAMITADWSNRLLFRVLLTGRFGSYTSEWLKATVGNLTGYVIWMSYNVRLTGIIKYASHHKAMLSIDHRVSRRMRSMFIGSPQMQEADR